MDIVKPKKKYAFLSSKKFIAAAVVGAVLLGIQFINAVGIEAVSESDLSFGDVQYGTLNQEVNGFGVLRSSTQTLLTAFVPGTIKEIRLRPGAPVEKDSIILILDNPELILAVENSQQAEYSERANLRKLMLSQQQELLLAEKDLFKTRKDFNVTKLRLETEKDLFERDIVSRLQFRETEANHELAKQEIEIQERLIAQLKKIHVESIAIQEDKIKQAQLDHKKELRRLESLTVKAGMKGLLQQLPVSLGQSVEAGQELVLVGSQDDLDAQIRVPQGQANLVQIGQLAVIDTRQHKIEGVVKRIDPTVKDGTVLIEVNLNKPLPHSARSELNVEGTIKVGKLANVLYIERPTQIKNNSSENLYQVVDSNLAKNTSVTFGNTIGRFIEIKAGAKAGDRFILSIRPTESEPELRFE